jgi:hypothetical protein
LVRACGRDNDTPSSHLHRRHSATVTAALLATLSLGAREDWQEPTAETCKTNLEAVFDWCGGHYASTSVPSVATAFTNPATYRLRGRDWAEAIEDAARFAAIRAADMVEAAGGGTLTWNHIVRPLFCSPWKVLPQSPPPESDGRQVDYYRYQ